MTTRLGLDALKAMNATPSIGDKLGPLNGQPTRLAFQHSLDRIRQRDILNKMVGPMDHDVAYQDHDTAEAVVERERLATLASRGNPGASKKYLASDDYAAEKYAHFSGLDTQSNTVATIDIRAENHGSIVLLFGMSEEGQSWLDRHVNKDAFRMGKGIVAEPRYVNDIIEGAIRDGLMVV